MRMSRIASKLRKIGWGKYDRYSGPWYKGDVPFTLPVQPDFGDHCMLVVTATEGGHLDAYNGYDRCKCTVGLFQWGEFCASDRPVSRMVMLCEQIDRETCRAHLLESGLSIMSTGYLARDGNVDPNYVFLGGATGLEGQWPGGSTGPAAQAARRVAASLASLWMVPQFAQVQIEYTKARLYSFAIGNMAALFGREQRGPTRVIRPFPTEGWQGAARLIALSFAANLPAVAARRVTDDTLRDLAHPDLRIQRDATISMAREMTFGPKAAIYPGRYNKIRPVVEQICGVDLPDFAEDLRKWSSEVGSVALEFPDVRSIQEELIALGYDIGPAGADGKAGPKTTGAVKRFQIDYDVRPLDGIVGPKTLVALARARDKRLGRTDHGASPQGRRSSSTRMRAVRDDDTE